MQRNSYKSAFLNSPAGRDKIIRFSAKMTMDSRLRGNDTIFPSLNTIDPTPLPSQKALRERGFLTGEVRHLAKLYANVNSMTTITRFFKSSPILIALSITLICFELFIAPAYIQLFGNTINTRHITTLGFLDGYTLLVCFILPVTINQFIFRQNLAQVGLQLPINKRKAIWLILLSLGILIPFLLHIAQCKEMQAFYYSGGMHIAKFTFIQLTLVPLYYFAEEFFFRGFLFLNLWERIGWHSFWITDLIFTWAHLSKPWQEIIYTIPAGIVFNYITLKTRSVYPAMFVHCTLGVIVNVFVNYVT